MLSAVVDSTVLVSAFLSKQGAAAALLARAVARAFTCFLAIDIIAETQRALHYPHIRERYTYTDEEIEAYGAIPFNMGRATATPRLYAVVPKNSPKGSQIKATVNRRRSGCSSSNSDVERGGLWSLSTRHLPGGH